MGQKVNPIGFRVGIIKMWDSRWYADKKQYRKNLIEDIKIRDFIMNNRANLPNLINSEISHVEIVRFPERLNIVIHTSRPGIIIGKKGEGIDMLEREVRELSSSAIYIKIKEVRYPERDANIVAQRIARQLERRAPFRRVAKMAVANTMKSGVKGIKIRISGRLGGAEMARSEEFKDGRIPLHTIRADIDYGFDEAMTTYGKIGVKVWIYRGDVEIPKTADDLLDDRLLRRT